MRAYIVLQIIFFLSINNYSQNQDKIKDYDGIPIITYGYGIYNPHTFGNYNFTKMTDAGIFALEVVDIDDSMYSDILSNTSLNIIADQVSNNVLNYINFYTYGRYSKWETEGTPESEGTATLSNNIAHTTISNGSVITNSNNIPDGTVLISGPKYAQEVTYSTLHTPIPYTANFRLKLEKIGFPLPQSTDVICTLRVYCAKWAVVNDTSWEIVDDYYYDKVLRYYEFTGGWENEILNYNLEDAYNHFLTDPMPESMYRVSKKNDNYVEYKFIEHVEFQVIWKGDESKVKLYLDDVTVYDSRGKRLIIDDLATTEINSQITEATNFKTKTAGWLSADEPYVIDNYAPIKKVNEIIDAIPNNNAHLWIAFPGHWSGTYGDPGNLNLYLNQVYQIDEFMKRVKKANIWMNCYMFNDPYDANFNPWPGGDYRIRNINRIGELLYKRCNDANQYAGVDLFWGASVQTGKYYIYQEQPAYIKTNYVEITSQQFLYTTNLALLYGAKLISPWLYFGFINDPIGNDLWDYTGLANAQDQYQENYKYFTLKDTIAPRLKGLLGKTLKKLLPEVQFTGLNGINYYPPTPPENPVNGYLYIEDIFPPVISQNNEYGIDLGFFSDPDDSFKKYFMVLNRYYSEEDNYQIHLKNLDTYVNWKLTNYVDTSSIYLKAVDSRTIFTDTLLKGDANLYSILPVVKYGGKLVYNETTTNGTTLYDDMSIESGATLTVNGTYTANADIIVKAGGKLKYGNDNSKIIFSNGAKLILEGNAQVYGTSSSNKFNLQYNTSTSIGVVVNPGASPIISYCNITGPLNGISVENEATLNVSNTSISNCTNTGIALFHFGNGESSSTLSTPNIYNCSISNCGTAISTVNCSEVIIKENTITQCNLGLYFNMVNSAYISSNTILGWQSATGSPLPGISMSSSGGYLRNNTIRYHNYGVQLAYSSPDLGVNTIEGNYKCGVYSGIGSYPNLVQQLANPQCWYPIGGCNVIKNNGQFTEFPPSNPSIQPDGAEIFLNSGDVLLSYGFNEISDDRTGIPTYLTIPLIKGTRSTGGSREFFVDHNYWGTVGPSPTRFGTLEADYDPTADYCPLPDAPCSGSELIIQTTDGQIIDTLDSRERETTEISVLEENYSTADKLYYSGDIEEAKTYYLLIVQGNYTNTEKLYAYNKLYEIGELLKEEDSYFTELQNAFNSIVEVETDTLLLKAFNQKSILCNVSKEEYLTAINKFENIIQQNPNSEEAVYAEIDIITTALNIDTTNPGLGKMGGGKYLVKGTSDYLSKLNDILQSKFGVDSDDTKHIIPKEYSLYQNYPNPFNPTTTIKFDIPKDGLITLEIFDLLGRRIVTLVNENRNAGSYEQVFNASSLASGVYVYKLQAGDFISSKKMILLK